MLLKSTAEKLDQARLTASQLVDTKTRISTLLCGLKNIELLKILDFDSPDCSYCSIKDVARSGQQRIECLAVIFSGSQNGGISYCDEGNNPFEIHSEGIKIGKGKPLPPVNWKDNWQKYFPSMASLESNPNIPKYLFTRGFIKKTNRSATTTPTSSSNMSSSSVSCSSSASSVHHSTSKTYSPIQDRVSFTISDNCNESYRRSEDLLELDLTPERPSRQLILSGDSTEFYVIDRISSDNKGYCSLLVAGSTPFEMEFNLDETCLVSRIFDSLAGTHRWMLYRDIVKGDLVIKCGTFVSITSIRTDMRITCCEESVGPSDVLFNNPPQLYKLHRDFFRMPSLSYPSPISIEM